MANIKFSSFTTETNPANVDFLVGYEGTTMKKIDPANVSGGAAYPFLIDTLSLYSGFVPTGLSGNPQNNTTLGISAGLGLTTGNENTLIGTLAASSLTTQNDNVVIGNKALRDTNNSSSSDNVIIGSEAVMDSSGQIERAVVVGRDACRNVGTFVNGAIAIGYRAARDMGYGDR